MNMKKVSSKILALVMACAMLFSFAAPALAAGIDSISQDENKEIHYVSLGDSMTNGYGLPGYEHGSGVETYGENSYANQFAAWLGADEHTQLAMSAVRVEDLLWLLTLDYNDAEAINVLAELITREKEWKNGSEECEALWNSVFSTGDFWTLSEICNHNRTDATYYTIAGTSQAEGGKYEGIVHEGKLPADYEYPTTYDPDANLQRGKNRAMKIAVIAKYFQENVTDADVISLAVGNGNFGVFGFGRILDAIGFEGAAHVDDNVYNVEAAIRNLDPETQEKILAYKAVLMAEVLKALPAEYAENEVIGKIAEEAAYIGLSMVISYMALYDTIVAMNPDVELIQVAIMNTFVDEGEVEGITIGKIMDAIVTPTNAFLAAYPTFKQVSEDAAYADATFYYAEAGRIECLVEVYGDDFYVDGAPNPNSIIRDRFVETIVGEDGNGAVWSLLKGALPLVPVSFEEIMAYELMNDEQKLGYAASNAEKAVSVAVYLAVEDAILNSVDASVTLDAILGLGNVDASLFAGVLDSFEENIEAGMMAQAMRACAVVAALVEANLEAGIKAQVGVDFDFVVTAENIISILNDGTGAQDIANAAAAVMAPVVGADTAAYVAAQIPGMIVPEVLENAEMIQVAATLFALPDALSTALQTNETVAGLLGLMGRCVIGNGLGGHPSAAGHDVLKEAVISAYESKYTAQDETIKNLAILADLVMEYYDEAYEVAYAEAVKAGVIDMINAYLEDAKTYVDFAEAWVAQYPEYIKSVEFATALSNTFANAKATIDAVAALINNADALDAETFVKVNELLAALTTNVNDINTLLEIAIVDVTPYVLALEAQAQLQINTLIAQAQYQLDVLNQQLMTAVGEAKAAILAEIARVQAELEAAIAQVKAELAAAIADAEAKFNAAVAELEMAIVVFNAKVEATIAEVEAIVAAANAKVNEVIEAVNAFVNGGYVETDTYAMLVAIVEAIENYIATIVSGKIELTENTFYLAIVDGNDGYADIIAKALNLGADQYKKVTMATVTVADIARADLITVAYSGASAVEYAKVQGIAYAGEYVDTVLRAQLNDYIKNVLGDVLVDDKLVEFEALLNGTIDGILATYVEGTVDELDWTALVGEENLTYVEKVEGKINDALVEAGVPEKIVYTADVVELLYAYAYDYVSMFKPSALYTQLGDNAYFTVEIPVMDIINHAVDSALYAYTEYNINYYKTMVTINEVNPDAAVAALGNYNRFDNNTNVVIGDVVINIAETLAAFGYDAADFDVYLDKIAEFTSRYPQSFAVEYQNVFYVDVTDANVGGDEYIANQILAALTVNCNHAYTDCEDAICNICGDERVPVGHNFTNYVSNGDATCTENGTKTATCDNGCGVTDTVVEENTALGHTEVTIPAVAPTCTDTGLTEGKKCSVCGTVTVAQTTVDAKGHTYNAGEITTAPTCEGAGVKTYTCVDCGHTYTEAVSAKGHTVVTVPGKAATCTETGLTDGKKCSVCNAVIEAQTTIAKKAHTEVTISGKAATCTETGLTDGKKCSVCNTVTVAQTTIAKKAHTEVTVPGTAATCTATGLTDGKKCSVCNTVTVAQTTIAALGHTEVTVPGTAATCTDTGLTDGKKCSVCDTVTVEQTTIAALGHTYDNGVVTTAPTYTAEGVKTFTCSVCGDTYTEAVAKLPTTNELTANGGYKVTLPAGSTAILDPNTVITVNTITDAVSDTVMNNVIAAIGGKIKANVLASYDISLLLDGASVQPGGAVAFTLPALENAGDYDKIVVVYIDANGDVATCETTVNEDGTITFVTDHFSQYSVIGVNDAPSTAWIWIVLGVVALLAAAGVVVIVIRKRKYA